MPHRVCLLPDTWLVPWMAVCDSVIAASYIAIPVALAIYARASGASVPRGYRRVVYGFGTFILLCGLTHIMSAVTLWWPVYRLQAAIMAACALASLTVAIAVVASTPQWTLEHWRGALRIVERERAAKEDSRDAGGAE